MDVKTTEHEIAERTKRWLKAELKRVDMTYEMLAAKLTELGLEETKISVANKLSRGTFPATFLVAVMKAIGKPSFSLSEIMD